MPHEHLPKADPDAYDPGAERCAGCGRVGVAVQIAITHLLEPQHTQQRSYCPRCWVYVKSRFDALPANSA